MIAGLNSSELIELAALLVATGALAGFLAGIFGIGGGAMLVPVLYECFRHRRRAARCADAALYRHVAGHHHPDLDPLIAAHHKRGSVDMDILRKWALPVLVGVILGSVIARYAPEKLFKIRVRWRRLVRGGAAAARQGGWRLGDEMPKGILMKVYGFFIGLLSTLMGIGGGLFSNLLMTFYGRPIHQAIGTSAGLAVLISIPGAIGYIYAGWPAAARFPEVAALQLPFAIGYISLIGALLVMPTSLLVAPLGVRVAHLLTKRKLEVAFGIYLLVVSSRFVVSLATGY